MTFKKPMLHQIVAVEKGIKARSMSTLTEIHKSNQKKELFNGLDRKYKAFNEADTDIPPDQSAKVQRVGEIILKSVAKQMTELFDVSATRDYGNTKAFADVVVDNVVLVKQAPAPYLLFLEKRLIDMRTLIDEIPTLDPSETWTVDVNSNLNRSTVSKTLRTRREKKVYTLSQATDKHAAVAQLVDIDENIGVYETVKTSGALPIPRKEELLGRVDTLIKAVKFAREQANSVEVENIEVGATIFGYLFK